MIAPGGTIGILGGGQLGRMLALAARPLGYRVHVLDPDPSCAARPVVEQVITARFDDPAAAAALARGVDVVTLEIEKIAPASLAAVAAAVPLRPGAHVLTTIQDRARQKAWLSAHGFPIGPWGVAQSAAELAARGREFGPGCFVKSSSGGYDGRGQTRLNSSDDADRAWAALGGVPCVVERPLDLRAELSVLVARRPSGESVVYAPALNHHERQILVWSVLPAPVPAEVVTRAQAIGRELAAKLDVHGLLVAELFWLTSGELLVNELAPRPHNSYHQSELACLTSQFEQGIRAACDLPLGSPEIVRPAAIVNLLGDLWANGSTPPFERALSMPGVRLQLYGKGEPRPARKMGHLTASGRTPEEAVERVQAAYAALEISS